MVAVAGGSDIRCAPYYAFGTQELSDAALAALKDRNACLLANHGVIATGADVSGAILLAGEVENLALQYTVALSLGEVRILDDTEMCRVIEKFRTYGQQNAADPDLIFGGAQPGAVECRWFHAAISVQTSDAGLGDSLEFACRADSRVWVIKAS